VRAGVEGEIGVRDGIWFGNDGWDWFPLGLQGEGAGMEWIGQAEVRIYDEFTRGSRRRDSVYDTTRRKMPHKEFDNLSDASNTTHWICSVRVASEMSFPWRCQLSRCPWA
jgi:hypothetical protein